MKKFPAFALGGRQKALAMLAPNTEDFYYDTSLHHRLSGDSEGFEVTIPEWAQFVRPRSLTERYQEMASWEAFLQFERCREDVWKFSCGRSRPRSSGGSLSPDYAARM